MLQTKEDEQPKAYEIHNLLNPELGVVSKVEAGVIDAAAPIGYATTFFGRHQKLDGSGFNELYQTPAADQEEQNIIARQALDHIIIGAMENSGWSPEDVEGIVVGNGTPADISFLPAGIAERHGMSNAVMCKTSMLACNSSAEVLFRTLADLDMRGRRILYIGFDDISRYTANPDACDELSPTTFSSGGAAMGIIPGVNLNLMPLEPDPENPQEMDYSILEGLHEFPDEDGVLAAVPPYHQHLNGTHLVQDAGSTRMVRLPVPTTARVLDMKGLGTSKFFLREVTSLIPRAYELFEMTYGTSDEQMIIAGHHPSPQLGHMMRKRLNKSHNQLQYPWVIEEGNVSGGTSAIALARILSRGYVGKEQPFMVAGYGAGGTATVFFARISA